MSETSNPPMEIINFRDLDDPEYMVRDSRKYDKELPSETRCGA